MSERDNTLGCMFIIIVISIIGSLWMTAEYLLKKHGKEIAIVVLVIFVLWIVIKLLSGSSSSSKGQFIDQRNESVKLLDILKNKEIDTNRGTAVIGGAGSGKTKSVIEPYIQRLLLTHRRGIIYDYKFPELTKISTALRSDVQIFNPIREETGHINVFDFCTTRMEVQDLWTNFSYNSKVKGEKLNFFDREAIQILSSITYALIVSEHKKASLRNIIELFVYEDMSKIIELLDSVQETRLTARKLSDTKKAGDQTAGIISTIIQLIEPYNTEHILKATDDTNIDIRGIVSIGSNQHSNEVYNPLLSMVFSVFIKQIEKDENPDNSFLIKDEAPTFRIHNFSKIPATLRYKGLTTVVAFQDISQYYEVYGENETAAIMSNLKYKFIGEITEPKTIQYVQNLIGKKLIKLNSDNRGKSGQITDILKNHSKGVSHSETYENITAEEIYTLGQGTFITNIASTDFIKVPLQISTIKKPIEVKKKGTKTML